MSGQATKNAERQTESDEQADQDKVVAGSRERAQVLRADEHQKSERNDHAPAVELPLPSLAEHEEDECRVEEILSSSHATIIRGRPLPDIGAEVEPRVDLPLNPPAEHIGG